VGIYTDQVLDTYKGKNRLEVGHENLLIYSDFLTYLDAAPCFRCG